MTSPRDIPLVTGMDGGIPAITELNERSREIFREIVDAYMDTGEPVGSRTISRRLSTTLSPATIRNVMADLEEAGLLFAPHTSAGRLPTEAGMRLFVNGLMEVGRLSDADREVLEARLTGDARTLDAMLQEAGTLLSGLARCAGLVLAPAGSSVAIKHLEVISLGPGRALVVLVTEGGQVENRVIDVPHGLPPSALREASNFLNAQLAGETLGEARERVLAELDSHRHEIDALAARVVEAGLADWGGETGSALIVRGQSHLLEDVTALEDLERIRSLFDALETREQALKLLELVGQGRGVQIFIGADNHLFRLSGCSMVVAPYRDSRERLVGAIGVIGPTRINYARIIPMVDYTAQVVGRLIG